MSPSGKAAVFGTAISEVRVLPPQNIKDLSLDGSFLMFWNGVLSPPSFHSRRSFKRGSTLSGILPTVILMNSLGVTGDVIIIIGDVSPINKQLN